MKIKADSDGKILAWGIEVQGEEYNDVVPGDFDATAGLGKYQFTGGEIVEVPDWVAPEPPIEPDPSADPEPEPEPEPDPEPEP
jgi:hypothetical protein